MATNELGEFLRARRARVQPVDVGLVSVGRRRVAGLRREEVAVVAGVSSDYYTRLEQGRERHPSAQILDALAGALVLDTQARQHLFRLANTVPPSAPAARSTVSDEMALLLESCPTIPAFVTNRALDVLATNRLADMVFAPFATTTNVALMVFTDPAARSFYVDWNRAAESIVGGLRDGAGHEPHDPRLDAVVAELSPASDTFARLWERHDIRAKDTEFKQLRHPDVGMLDIVFQSLDVRGCPGHQLNLYLAPAGTATVERLALLGSIAATPEWDPSETLH